MSHWYLYTRRITWDLSPLWATRAHIIIIYVLLLLCAVENKKLCEHGCQNGGTCNDRGHCECVMGYLGQHCQQGTFVFRFRWRNCLRWKRIACVENVTLGQQAIIASAQHEDVMIKCRFELSHYSFSFFAAACFPECLNNGVCIKPGFCKCMDNYEGKLCDTGER